jgi:hypothetical protein
MRLSSVKLPRRYAPFVYGVIQAAVTTAIATAIATHQMTDFNLMFVQRWIVSWLLAWVSMLPVVIVVSPIIQRAVLALTATAGPSDGG